MEQEEIRLINSEKCWEQERERQQKDIHLLSYLFSELFFGLRTVNWVIMADCHGSGVLIPFI